MSPEPPCWIMSDQSLVSISRATTITGAEAPGIARTRSTQLPSERLVSLKITCTGLNLARSFSACRHDRARHVSIPCLASVTRNVCNGSNFA
jgi:hypothetical protein